MSDKIIILTHRPATVKKELEINLKDIKTPFERRENPKTKEYFDIIWRDLQ